MTPQTRALIEAAEEVLNIWAMPKSIYLKLRAAISSAKAAEEGVEILTAEQVLDECDEYCNTKGNPILGPVMRHGFAKDKRMPQAVLVSLNIEPVMMYKRLSVREKEGLHADKENR